MIPSVLLAAVAGVCLFGGIVLSVKGLRTPELSLSEYERSMNEASVERTGRGKTWASSSARHYAKELELCEMTPDDFVRARVLWSLLFMSIPAMFLLLAIVIPVFPIAPIYCLIGMVLAAVAGWFYAVVDLKSDAAQRRAEFAETVATYIDLTAILVAGGSGAESALYEAVTPGRGPAFRLMRRALGEASVRRQGPWRALGSLAERLDLPDLEELCSSMELAARGSKVQQTLRVRATSLRDRELSSEEADANAKSETLVYPVLLMFVGFLLLIGYPTLASLSSAG